MAFFISDITGAQKVYNTDLVRQIVAEQQPVSSVSEEEVAEVLAESAVGTTRVGENSTVSSINPDTIYTQASPEAMGTAGASMLHRGYEGGTTNVDAGDMRETRTPERVTPVRKSHQVRARSDDTGEQRMRKKNVINAYHHLDDPVPERKPAILAEQIMTSPVVTIGRDRTQADVVALFGQKKIRHVPVTTEGRLVGIVSDRDILKHANPETPIEDMMTSNIITARPYTEIRMIAQLLFQERISAMPIVDDHEQLVGMVTTRDILRTIVNQAPLELWV